MALRFNNYKPKPVTQAQRDGWARDRITLEMAQAREFLATWNHMGADSNRNEWLKKALANTAKLYGPQGPERIRKYMRVAQNEIFEILS